MADHSDLGFSLVSTDRIDLRGGQPEGGPIQRCGEAPWGPWYRSRSSGAAVVLGSRDPVDDFRACGVAFSLGLTALRSGSRYTCSRRL